MQRLRTSFSRAKRRVDTKGRCGVGRGGRRSDQRRARRRTVFPQPVRRPTLPSGLTTGLANYRSRFRSRLSASSNEPSTASALPKTIPERAVTRRVGPPALDVASSNGPAVRRPYGPPHQLSTHSRRPPMTAANKRSPAPHSGAPVRGILRSRTGHVDRCRRVLARRSRSPSEDAPRFFACLSRTPKLRNSSRVRSEREGGRPVFRSGFVPVRTSITCKARRNADNSSS